MVHFQGFFAEAGWEDCSVFEEDYWPNGREMVTVAMILSQLIWPESSLVWSATSDELFRARVTSSLALASSTSCQDMGVGLEMEQMLGM